MCWGAPGSFNMASEATITATSKPGPQGCVGKDRNYDLSTGSSKITGGGKGLDNKSCRDTNSHTVRNIL